eukprot:6581470-Lingulodinium_polyedra.AAC.1
MGPLGGGSRVCGAGPSLLPAAPWVGLWAAAGASRGRSPPPAGASCGRSLGETMFRCDASR